MPPLWCGTPGKSKIFPAQARLGSRGLRQETVALRGLPGMWLPEFALEARGGKMKWTCPIGGCDKKIGHERKTYIRSGARVHLQTQHSIGSRLKRNHEQPKELFELIEEGME